MVLTLQILIIKIEYGVDFPSQHLSVCHCYIYDIWPNYSQSVRWSKRPASQCVRRLVKASDVIGQSVRCDWSMCPMWLV